MKMPIYDEFENNTFEITVASPRANEFWNWYIIVHVCH